jgi:hypothetical protein
VSYIEERSSLSQQGFDSRCKMLFLKDPEFLEFFPKNLSYLDETQQNGATTYGKTTHT